MITWVDHLDRQVIKHVGSIFAEVNVRYIRDLILRNHGADAVNLVRDGAWCRS